MFSVPWIFLVVSPCVWESVCSIPPQVLFGLCLLLGCAGNLHGGREKVLGVLLLVGTLACVLGKQRGMDWGRRGEPYSLPDGREVGAAGTAELRWKGTLFHPQYLLTKSGVLLWGDTHPKSPSEQMQL